ncbi:hypothetical protein HDU67_004313, partial [Dinochytrium kinnereticum]
MLSLIAPTAEEQEQAAQTMALMTLDGQDQLSLMAMEGEKSEPVEDIGDLVTAESRIDMKVLVSLPFVGYHFTPKFKDSNIFTKNHLSRDDNDRKQRRFRRTVFAVQAIVSAKLYKTKSASLEAYFKDVWKISRAQVYRFLDCAAVLRHLEGFQYVPCRERLCRSLKRLAKNRSDTRKLWASVLDR